MRTKLVLTLFLFLIATSFVCQADPIAFPQGYIPFSFLDYETFPDQGGYSLVVGETTTLADRALLLQYLNSLPSIAGNQQYGNNPIELAPGQFFNNVLVPTYAERQGDFQDFGYVIYDPETFSPSPVISQFAIDYSSPPGNYLPFPGNYLPLDLVGDIYAFRLGAGDGASAAPEPDNLLLCALGIVALGMSRRIAGRSA